MRSKCPECGKIHLKQRTAHECLSRVSNLLTLEIIGRVAAEEFEKTDREKELGLRLDRMQEYYGNLR